MAPIPVRDEGGNMRLIMDKVDVDEGTLQAVASKTGGSFYRATDTDSLEKIYEQINQLETTAHTVQKFEHYDELYSWAVIPAAALLGFGLVLQHTRYRRLP
jgi:Ca-activated chloride channel family protein